MELLYVWVENFRNIKNKGFNFSNQFNIDYDFETNKVEVKNINGDNSLIVEDGNPIINIKSSYLDGFFDKRISNVSAIIGKNSTGKSNIIEFILTALHIGRRDQLVIFPKNETVYK